LIDPELELDDCITSLSMIKPSVSKEDLVKHQEFTNEFGQEGK